VPAVEAKGEAPVDLRLLFSTFGLVFLAELGDKTQLATLTLAASGHSRLAVFLGAAGALVLTSAIAVLAGAGLVRVVPEVWLHRAAGVGFIVMGALFLAGRG
jgi:putative Ca2+/H+ antiporter (TMEM165/GDT1 family)